MSNQINNQNPGAAGNNNSERLDIVEVAKIMRKDLKVAFPGIKFKVRCDRFSMGESIDVFYDDGPAEKDVNAVIKKHDRVHYDEYSGEILGGGNRYVNAQRHISDAFLQKAKDFFEKKFGHPCNMNDHDEYIELYKSLSDGSVLP